MHPLDDVVTYVHRIDILGQQFDLECITIAGSLVCLVPPARAFDKRRTHGLRGATINVVDDRLDGLADIGLRVLLVEAVPATVIHT